ncbi:MAG TPA: sterol desaturase family protein [Stellaceae bacterium]|nr:sterol desaturase family protein [Stellaceae bacterium]
MGFGTFIDAVWQRVGSVELGLAGGTVILAVLGAGYTFLTHDYHDEPRTWRGFLRFCLPARIVMAQQTRLDIGYAVVKKLVHFLWTWLFIGNLAFAYLFYRVLNHHQPPAVGSHHPTALQRAVFLVVGIIIYDFLGFFAHYLLHKLPAMWLFHKVHHSALTLIPVTNRRFHPVQEIWDALWNSAGIGVWIALYSSAMSVPLADVTILGVNAIIFVNCFSFVHLRHSHIYMRYPHWLECVFMSPAQHQIHHSREERHLDRNFGLFLSCWDQLFGTITYSEPVPAANLGLIDGQENYLSLWQLFATPFIEFERTYCGRLKRMWPAGLLGP